MNRELKRVKIVFICFVFYCKKIVTLTTFQSKCQRILKTVQEKVKGKKKNKHGLKPAMDKAFSQRYLMLMTIKGSFVYSFYRHFC